MEDADVESPGDVLAGSHHEVEVLYNDERSYSVDYVATADQTLSE
jgi:hypothetical protein